VGECGENEECVQAQTGGWVCVSSELEIPAGDFWMGCNETVDTSCYDDEYPYHLVYLDKYWMDRTEVTMEQFAACESAGGCTAPETGTHCTWQGVGKENHPLNCMTWAQAKAYCVWAGKRLCTEAEWEKGARGGCEKNGGDLNCEADSRRYPWVNQYANCQWVVMGGCPDEPQPVCSLSPAGDSPYGVCDIGGNVWEWVEDYFQKDYYCDGDQATGDQNCAKAANWPGGPAAWSNPPGPGSGSTRVVRGGGFFYYDFTTALRVSYRGDFLDPALTYNNVGIRCCRSE